MEQVRVLHDEADRIAHGVEREITHVVAVEEHAAFAHVGDPRNEHRGRRLARSGRSDERDELTGLDDERHVAQDPAALHLVVGDGALLEGGQGRHGGGRVPEPHVIELDASLRRDQVEGAGPVVDQRGEVEHLEHALERHQRGQHVDASVRELREWLVDLGDVHREGGHRPDRQRSGDHQVAADVVDDRGTDRGDEAERDEQHARVHGARHADVSDALGPIRELLELAVLLAEELHDQRAGDVEALGGRVVHRRVQLHALAGDAHELPTDAPGRDDERRQDDQGQDRQPPLEPEHDGERHGEADDVAHDGSQRVGDRLLGADHVVVHT